MGRLPTFAAITAWIGAAAPLAAQCSMCRTVAAAQGESAKVLDAAIIVLFIPAMALFSGIVLMAFRYRANPRADAVAQHPDLEE
jgi:hypothetical protein